MTTGRAAVAVAVTAAAAVAVAWLFYAVYIGLFAWEGEYCTDADRSTCEEADRLYNVSQIALSLLGLGLTTRAITAGVRYVRGRGSRADARAAATPALIAFVLWTVLVGGRIVVAGHPW